VALPLGRETNAQAGKGINIARQASIHAGIPVTAPAMTVNRTCGSGAQAVATAYAEVSAALSRMVIAGGIENMNRAPCLLPGMQFSARMGNAEAVDSLLLDGLHVACSTKHSGWHTEDRCASTGTTCSAVLRRRSE
jgi:acetyl-CoA C-acetyltransferase